MKNRKRPLAKILSGLAIVLLILVGLDTAVNKNKTDMADLSEWDQRALNDFKIANEADAKANFWKDYRLGDHPILLISKDSHYSYLIGPKKKPSSLFASPITGIDLDVYRVTRTYPGLWGVKLLGGNFNTIDKTTRILGNDVYYMKFDSSNFTRQFLSEHLMNFLYHESFHYFKQNNWIGGGRFSAVLTANGMKLLEERLKLFDQARDLVKEGEAGKAKLKEVAQKIVENQEKRRDSDPDYVDLESMMETTEGTATFMGIMASRAVGYDYGPMYFDNAKDVPFSDVIPFYKDKKLSEGFLRDRLPYETGAQLTLILQSLDPEGAWQGYLDGQDKTEQRTLMDALKLTLENNL